MDKFTSEAMAKSRPIHPDYHLYLANDNRVILCWGHNSLPDMQILADIPIKRGSLISSQNSKPLYETINKGALDAVS